MKAYLDDISTSFEIKGIIFPVVQIIINETRYTNLRGLLRFLKIRKNLLPKELNLFKFKEIYPPNKLASLEESKNYEYYVSKLSKIVNLYTHSLRSSQWIDDEDLIKIIPIKYGSLPINQEFYDELNKKFNQKRVFAYEKTLMKNIGESNESYKERIYKTFIKENELNKNLLQRLIDSNNRLIACKKVLLHENLNLETKGFLRNE